MDRLAIINRFVEKYSYKSYLNIGVFTGYTLDHVTCPYKIGVDPEPHHYSGKVMVIPTGSDEFFSSIPEDTKYDIIFIDGMHLKEYVERDIANSLKHLAKGGTIVLHDINPPTPQHADRSRPLPEWNGDCYKAFLKFRNDNTQYLYDTYVIDTDWGVGVIREAVIVLDTYLSTNDYQKAINDWDFFDKNRQDLLNLISIEEFLNKTK